MDENIWKIHNVFVSNEIFCFNQYFRFFQNYLRCISTAFLLHTVINGVAWPQLACD